MEVASTADGGKVLGVATTVTLGVVMIDAGDSVQGLVDVTEVVDDHAESEGPAVSINGEVLGNLLVVVGGQIVVAGAVEPHGEVGEGAEDVVSVGDEAEVVKGGVGVDQVGLIDEVPAGLEAVVALDVVGESSGLNEGVVELTGDEVGLGNRQGVQLGKDKGENLGVLVLEDSLGLSGDYKGEQLGKFFDRGMTSY